MEIPGYRIQHEIGKGGMATVYLAVQESLGRPVVLKVMSTSLDTTPEFTKRFLNEGHLLASVTHPNIITIFDIGIATDFLYISMEYLGGGDLAARIAAGIESMQALAIVRSIATALSVAHAKGIVHRDVKPANILFRNDGTPVLTDFGIAKQSGDTELTSTGTILGSPYYMSPEQAEGRLELDGRSDIYSLGVIFFEMLTGRRPYDGDSAIHIVLQHLQSPLPTLPGELDVFQPLLNLMLAKKRDARLADAHSLVEYIKALQSPDTPEAIQVLKRLTPRAETPVPGASRSARNRMLSDAPRAHGTLPRNWMIFGGTLLLLTGVVTGYFVHEIRQYSNVTITPAQRAWSVPTEPAPLPPTAATPARGELDPFERQVVTALKWLGRRSLEDGRLTSPPDDNALYYFRRLLEIDPGDTQARDGIVAVARTFGDLAEEQIRRKNYSKAEEYVVEGLRVDPSNKRLQVLQSSVQLRERALLESLRELLLGGG